jgi:transcriptional regulator with XRE-family HTH domain
MSIGNFDIPKGILSQGKIMLPMGNLQEFAEWLQGELDRRGWDQSKLARRAGVSQGQVSRVLSGTRGLGPDTCRAIARALDLPEEVVFRKAGLLSEKSEEAEKLKLLELIILLESASDEDLDLMIEMARVVKKRSSET